MDLSEELRRLYNGLDSLDRLAADKTKPLDHDEVAFVAGGMRAYLDSIARQVDYDTDEDDEE